MSDNNDSVFPFFRLPRELRDEIYKIVFQSAPWFWLTTQHSKGAPDKPNTIIWYPDSWRISSPGPAKFSHAFPALCRASRQLFIEATPVLLTSRTQYGDLLYHPSTISEDTSRTLYKWYEQFPNDEGFKSAGSLHIGDMTRGASVHMDLATRCTNIRYLAINFDYDGDEEDYYYHKDEPLLSVSSDAVQIFISANCLDRIFDMPNLELFCPTFQDRTKNDNAFFHRMHFPLRIWLMEECRRRGRVITWWSLFEADIRIAEREREREKEMVGE